MADYKITNYEDHKKLEQARLMLKQELDAFMPDYSKVQQIGMDFDSFYNTGIKDNWRTIAVKLGDNQDPVEHADKFSNTLEILSECKGVENFGMNFVKPYGRIMPHTDPEVIVDGKEVPFINCLAGVVIPSANVHKCGMMFDNKEVAVAEGEWVTFLPSTKHSAWNYTDHYRLTCMSTINLEYFSS